MRNPERVEPVDEAADERRRVPARQSVDQGVSRQGRQRKRQEKGDVVGGNRTSAKPLNGRGHRGKAEQQLREGQRTVRRPEGRGVPPRGCKRHGVGVPPDNPRIQDRVAGVVRDDQAKTGDERPRLKERETDVEKRRQQPRQHAAHSPAALHVVVLRRLSGQIMSFVARSSASRFTGANRSIA